jgi:hypothetical protein
MSRSFNRRGGRLRKNPNLRIYYQEGRKPPPPRHAQNGYAVTVPNMTRGLLWRIVAVHEDAAAVTLRTMVMESPQEMTVPWAVVEPAEWAA